MLIRSFALALVSLAACSLAGCSAPPIPDAGARDGGSTACLGSQTRPGAPLWFAMTDVFIEPQRQSPAGNLASGFNIDNLNSEDPSPEGCMILDDYSVFDSDPGCTVTPCGGGCYLFAGQCHAGVDNRLPLAADTLRDNAHLDMRASASQAIAAGRFTLLIELLDVDDCANDSSVRVRLFRGFAAPGTVCATPVAGSVYQIERASLRPSGVSPDDAIVELPARIENWRVRMPVNPDPGTAVFPLRWPLTPGGPAERLDLPTHHPLVAFNLQGDSATHGNLGGWVLGADAVTALVPALPAFTADELRAAVAFMVDIMVGGVCVDATVVTSLVLGGVSIGFGFSAVQVRIDETNPVVDAPMRNSCAFAEARGDAGD